MAASRSRHSGLSSPIASANSAILTRLTSYGSPGPKTRPVNSALSATLERCPWLAGLAVRLVAAAVRAVLLQLKTIRVVAPVLLGDVVAVLALLASQRDLRPNIGGSHDGVPFYYAKVWTIQVTGQSGSSDPNSNTLTSTPRFPPSGQPSEAQASLPA